MGILQEWRIFPCIAMQAYQRSLRYLPMIPENPIKSLPCSTVYGIHHTELYINSACAPLRVHCLCYECTKSIKILVLHRQQRPTKRPFEIHQLNRTLLFCGCICSTSDHEAWNGCHGSITTIAKPLDAWLNSLVSSRTAVIPFGSNVIWRKKLSNCPDKSLI